MIRTGICPKCETVIQSVSVQDMPIHVNFQHRWNGVSYTCPQCHTILGAGIDLIALKADIVDEIAARFGRA